jgi:hypothetical protein
VPARPVVPRWITLALGLSACAPPQWGKSVGIWRNHPAADCATLTFPDGNHYTFWTGTTNTCPAAGAVTPDRRTERTKSRVGRAL